MKIKQLRLSLLLLLTMLMISAGAYACSCINGPLTFHYQQAQFVAKAKIIKITPDPSNPDYHDAEIELIALYKGERRTKIKIMSVMNSSCRFLPDKNSTWLIFAKVNGGVASFGRCSGSLAINRLFDQLSNPYASKNPAQTIPLKEEVLDYLKHHPVPKPYGMEISNSSLDSISGYKNTNRFAVFKVNVNTDLSITGIKVLKKFQNATLTKAVMEKIKTNTTFKVIKDKPTKPVQITIFCYYYERDGAGESFVSILDV